MPFTLPELPYAFDALTPHIDAKTMEIHHGKHHKAYVDNANKALDGTKWADMDPVEVIKHLGDLPADKMGPGLREFAEYQPFTPIIETIRGLLNGTPQTNDAIAAIAWSAGIALVGYLWALSTFKKRA